MQVLNDREAAKFLGIAVQTMRNWRFRRVGPPYVRLNNRRIVYQIEALIHYLRENRIVPNNGAINDDTI